MRTCFLLTHVPDPKTNRRIKIFKEFGNTSVICTRRKSQDIWEPFFKDVRHYIYNVDLPTAQHIFQRYVISKKYQKKALEKLEELQPDIIYADGLDSLMIATKYKKLHTLKLFYDVADLRETYIEKPRNPIKNVINGVIKKVEMSCFKMVDYLVITSEKFYEMYYYKLINKENVLFIPNVPDQELFESYRKKDNGDFTIGFIGGIRYLNQMKMLVDAAGECGYKVLFAGAGGTAEDYKLISEYCRNKSYVRFTGKYDYSKDIASLYSQVDCVYAVYNADNPNVRIALPNKLYESILCELPILVAKGTYLAELVKKWGVGVPIEHDDKDKLVFALKELATNSRLNSQIRENCERMKKEMEVNRYAEEFGRCINADME